MEKGRECFGQTVGERLDENRAVVVVLAFELPHQIVGAETSGHRECSDVIGDGRRPIGDADCRRSGPFQRGTNDGARRA
jgi:hypothetical protein